MGYLEKRILDEAEFIVSKRCTVREAAKSFNVSKSTVHKDVTDRLKEIDEGLFLLVREILDVNLSERHIRGGIATKVRYSKKRKNTT